MVDTSPQAVKEYLIAQLDAITNPDLSGKDLREELNRAAAVCKITGQMNKANDQQLKAAALYAEHANTFKHNKSVGRLLGIESNE